MKHFWLTFLILPLFISACKKGDLEMKSTEIGIDPAVNMDMVNQLLQCEGTLIDGDLPAKRKGRLGKLFPIMLRDGTAKTDTIFYAYDDSLFFSFQIPSLPTAFSYSIRSLRFKLQGAKSYWKVPAIDDKAGNYAFTFSIPRLIKPSDLRIDFNAEVFATRGNERDSAVTDSGTVFIKAVKPVSCGDTIIYISKGNGIQRRQFLLGDVPGKVKIFFNTGGIGDRLDVKYNGKFIYSTCPTLMKPWEFPKCNAPAECFPRTNSNFMEFSFEYDPLKSKILEFFIVGFCSVQDTGWRLTVQCP